MRIKTIVIIVITVLLTIALMQNTGPDYLNFLWATFELSKLSMLLVVVIVGFVLGYLVGRPKKIKRLGGDDSNVNLNSDKSDTLSDRNRDYLN